MTGSGGDEYRLDPAIKGDFYLPPGGLRQFEDPAVEDNEGLSIALDAIRSAEQLYESLSVRLEINTRNYPEASSEEHFLAIAGPQRRDQDGNLVARRNEVLAFVSDSTRQRVDHVLSARFIVEGEARPLVTRYSLCYDGTDSRILFDSGLRPDGSDAVANTVEGLAFHSYYPRSHRVMRDLSADVDLADFLTGLRREQDGTLRMMDNPTTLAYLGKQVIRGMECVGISQRRVRNSEVRSEQRYWFSEAHNYLPVLYECWAPENSSLGPECVTITDGFHEISAGIYFPKRSRTWRLSRQMLQDNIVSPGYLETIDVRDVTLDPPVPDSL